MEAKKSCKLTSVSIGIFWPLQSPCREDVWGQLSIIGPQLISEEVLVQKERDEGGRLRGRDAEDVLGVREQGLWIKQDERKKKLTQHTEGKARTGRALIRMLHIHAAVVCVVSLIKCSAFVLHSLCLREEALPKLCIWHVNTAHYLLLCIHLFKALLWFIATWVQSFILVPIILGSLGPSLRLESVVTLNGVGAYSQCRSNVLVYM